METYQGYINEFVDWVTGQDTSQLEQNQNITRASSTNGLPVSGGSIRELLQTHLKTPFVYYEDVNAGLYRLFSSTSTRDKWIRMNNPGSSEYDPDASANLELFNFERPADVVMTYTGISNSPKYIIYGNANSDASKLSFNVYLSKEQGGGIVYESDTFTITYTILDADGNTHTDVVEYRPEYLNNSNMKVEYDIYRYLTIGKNEVTLTMKAKNSSAKNAINFSVYMLQFEISSTFNYAKHWSSMQDIEVPVSIKRSSANLTLTVDVYIDGEYATLSGQNAASTWQVTNSELNPSRTFLLENKYASNNALSDHIKHTVRIQASMYDSNNQTTFYSNVLFYDFVISSNTTGLTNKFINSAYSIQNDKINIDPDTNRVIIQAVQYEPIEFNWAYYTEQIQTDQSIPVVWSIRKGHEGSYVYDEITTLTGINGQTSETLRFLPNTSTTSSDNAYLVASYKDQEIDVFPISIQPSSLNITETGSYNLKLSTYGKSNSSPDRDQWVDDLNNIRTDFVGIRFDTNSGWNDNSLVIQGVDSYAQVNYCPFPSGYDIDRDGKTIEIDFKTERVDREDDVVIRIGHENNAHIDITTNAATLYLGNEDVVHTNFKANERIKLAFIFNKADGSKNNNLVYIVNNGILERAASMGSTISYNNQNGKIIIGQSNSGVRVYSIRAYDKAITYNDELNNFIFDSDDKALLINRNDILQGSQIDYNLCKGKIDIINIEGDLDAVLRQGSLKDESESTVNFERECITDETKSFSVKNGKIRKHGQSTLNYPITSLKIWTNKAKEDDVVPTITLSETQQAEGLNKNRYIMKTGAIPANKYVLQANYADSSGVHNGGLLRLIQDTWYKAIINGEYKLRTAPQLFTSNQVVHHNDEDLHEDGSWVEGYGNTAKSSGKQWGDFTDKAFPYTIRIAPDSFPCAVFYTNTGKNGDGNRHFLGQYVFMDDKKSDYTYGERSIYFFGNGSDPFVLKTENTKNGANGKQDTKENRVWDNENTLRIEVVLPNQKLTSYMDFNVPATVVKDENGEIVDSGSSTVPCTDIKYDDRGNPVQFYWEDYFEMIFPDDEDVAEDDAKNGLTKYSENSKFRNKVQPFISFLKWITDCKNNYNRNTEWWSAGTYNSTQSAFEATAHDHLDLHKVAAYYIFFLRFGLVDSVERNAQLKTYDGQHWHYEPWDMDIALGNTNQGQLIFNPPIDRNSYEPGTTTYAFSGRSQKTSNVLWDCLENWNYWSDTIVPDVAQALYTAGLTYDNIVEMFDEQYAERWPETMYNESGYFKYIENGGSDWLPWLQGSRTSHRHWWISTSMNYYDAKWSCGSFNEHRIRIFADKEINPAGTDIVTITPTSHTFFKFAIAEGKTSLGTIEADKSNSARFDISRTGFSAKDPAYIYGGTFIEEINLSCLAEKLKAADLSLCYDDVLGAPIKVLNVGIPHTKTSDTVYSGKTSGTQLRLTGYDTSKEVDAFANLKTLDITGQSTITSTQDLIATYNRKNLQNLYAIGTSITQFISAPSGNTFGTIQLPASTTITSSGSVDRVVQTFNTMVMQNSSWQNIEFWDTTKSDDVVYVYDENNEIVVDDDGNPITEANVATFTKTTVPATMQALQFLGSTARNACSMQLLLDWIQSIDNSLGAGHTEEDLYAALRTKTFRAENINWVSTSRLGISYNDLARIAQFNNGANRGGMITGYIMISNTEQLTPTQLSELKSWFGDSVFDKGATGSGLVIDQSTEYVQINVGGPHVYVEDDYICLNEGGYATLNATKFVLSEDSTEYSWTVADGNDIRTDGIKSVTISRGADGLEYIYANEGDYGDYVITITASYVDPNTGRAMSSSADIKIIGVTYPDAIDFEIRGIDGKTPREFMMDTTIANQFSIFNQTGTNLAYNGQELNKCVVLYSANQSAEFFINPTSAPGKSYTASLRNVYYSFENVGPLAASQFAESNAALIPTSSQYLYYSKNAVRGGVVLNTGSLMPENMTICQLTCSCMIGGRQVRKVLNIILYDDASILLDQANSSSRMLFNILNDKYNELYGVSVGSYFYKSTLMSIHGELDFSSEPTIQNLLTNTSESVFLYLENLTSLKFNGCTNLVMYDQFITGQNKNVFRFDNMTNLQSLDLSGCTSLTGSIDLSNCSSLTVFVSEGSPVGVIFPTGSAIQTIKLGNPSSIVLNSPTTVGTSGTLSIESSANLTNIELVNVNRQAVKGFGVFNTIYNV